jgi:hypothetical protein
LIALEKHEDGSGGHWRGATGPGFCDLALRGIDTILLEKKNFSGTSGEIMAFSTRWYAVKDPDSGRECIWKTTF